MLTTPDDVIGNYLNLTKDDFAPFLDMAGPYVYCDFSTNPIWEISQCYNFFTYNGTPKYITTFPSTLSFPATPPPQPPSTSGFGHTHLPGSMIGVFAYNSLPNSTVTGGVFYSFNSNYTYPGVPIIQRAPGQLSAGPELTPLLQSIPSTPQSLLDWFNNVNNWSDLPQLLDFFYDAFVRNWNSILHKIPGSTSSICPWPSNCLLNIHLDNLLIKVARLARYGTAIGLCPFLHFHSPRRKSVQHCQ